MNKRIRTTYQSDLAKLRMKTGLSRKAIAEKTGISVSTITSWECGETAELSNAISLKSLMAFADIYNISVNEIGRYVSMAYKTKKKTSTIDSMIEYSENPFYKRRKELNHNQTDGYKDSLTFEVMDALETNKPIKITNYVTTYRIAKFYEFSYDELREISKTFNCDFVFPTDMQETRLNKNISLSSIHDVTGLYFSTILKLENGGVLRKNTLSEADILYLANIYDKSFKEMKVLVASKNFISKDDLSTYRDYKDCSIEEAAKQINTSVDNVKAFEDGTFNQPDYELLKRAYNFYKTTTLPYKVFAHLVCKNVTNFKLTKQSDLTFARYITGKTASKIAEEIGTYTTSVFCWESCKQVPSKKFYELISIAYNINIDDVLQVFSNKVFGTRKIKIVDTPKATEQINKKAEKRAKKEKITTLKTTEKDELLERIYGKIDFADFIKIVEILKQKST